MQLRNDTLAGAKLRQNIEDGYTMRAFLQSMETEHEDTDIPRERWGHDIR